MTNTRGMSEGERWSYRIRQETSPPPNEFLDSLIAIDGMDIESRHMVADCLMVDLLISLGYHNAMRLFESWVKWYA